jgi:23S rRNA (cytidine1920-2'-O)/16S rRNA (cytidine1409-2'-O)-methyltransferase
MHNPPKSKGREKHRLDALMVIRGLSDTADDAQRHILAHEVTVNGSLATKAGERFPSDADVKMVAPERFVSRGALKLEAALNAFKIKAAGLVCADIGSSTGGFTDSLLQRGAKRIFAVDVGRTQLHERVRTDERVTVCDHTNARQLTTSHFEEPPSLFVVDVSFISVKKILTPLFGSGPKTCEAVILVKPQFEAERDEVNRGRGIIRDEAAHARILHEVATAACAGGWMVVGLIPSPILGGEGNREFLMHLRKHLAESIPPSTELGFDVDAAIATACKSPPAE